MSKQQRSTNKRSKQMNTKIALVSDPNKMQERRDALGRVLPEIEVVLDAVGEQRTKRGVLRSKMRDILAAKYNQEKANDLMSNPGLIPGVIKLAKLGWTRLQMEVAYNQAMTDGVDIYGWNHLKHPAFGL
jgi:hypothetical protein